MRKAGLAGKKSRVMDIGKGGLCMFNSWDLHVTNFGRIKEATITVSPLYFYENKTQEETF